MPNNYFPFTLTVYNESVFFDEDNEEANVINEELFNPNYTLDSLSELCNFLKTNVAEASESPLNGSTNAWYISNLIQDQDYFERGIHKHESYHLNGLPDSIRIQVARFMTAQKICY